MPAIAAVVAFVVVYLLVIRFAWPWLDACTDLRDCDCPFCARRDVERRLSL
jgi:hypothetical protein